MAPRINRRLPLVTPFFTPASAATARAVAAPSSKRVCTAPRSKASDMAKWLRSLRETQGGVVARFPSTSKRKKVRRSMADSCSGVSRHLAARALGLFREDATYRDEARHFRSQIATTKPLYPKLSRRLSATSFARVLAKTKWYREHTAVLERLQSTQSMLTPARIQRYNRDVLPRQLQRIGGKKAGATNAEFHAFFDYSYGRRQLKKALASGAPVVVGLSAHYKGRWHENCHYVLAVKLPGHKRVMVLDSWPNAKHGGVTFQRLDRLKMPGTYGSNKVRLGTRFGFFRNRDSKKPLTIETPCIPSSK
jgi:hypothetical protein